MKLGEGRHLILFTFNQMFISTVFISGYCFIFHAKSKLLVTLFHLGKYYGYQLCLSDIDPFSPTTNKV